MSTGKTTEIGRWAARAATRYGHDRVLVCSLTKAGAKQASRDVALPYSQLGTVHGFASRALGSPTIAEAKVKEWNEAYPTYALSAHSATADDSYGSKDGETYGDDAKLQASWYRTMGIPTTQWPESVVGFYEKWTDWKKQCGYLDFTDLIEVAYTDCDKAPGDPAVILCDEAQDTGGLEMKLLMKWGEKAEHLVLAGDSQQAIFGWRGSDALLLQRLWQTHDPSRQPLQQSYRLSRAVYAKAYRWAQRFEQTIPIAFVPRDVEGSVQRLSSSFKKFSQGEIERLVEQYTKDDNTLMFQTTCGYMLHAVITRLRDAGIPFWNPSRPNHGKWNPLPKGRSGSLTVIDRVLAFTRPDSLIWNEQARFWSVRDIKAWVAGLPVENILARGKRKEIESLSDKATDEDIADMIPSWFTPEALAHIVPKPDVSWYMEHMSKGSDVLREYVLKIIDRRGVAALRQRPQVICGTVHSLKGAEASTVVMCPDISTQAYDAMRQSADVAEEMRRVFYVGITRARDGLLLCSPGSKLAVLW